MHNVSVTRPLIIKRQGLADCIDVSIDKQGLGKRAFKRFLSPQIHAFKNIDGGLGEGLVPERKSKQLTKIKSSYMSPQRRLTQLKKSNITAMENQSEPQVLDQQVSSQHISSNKI